MSNSAGDGCCKGEMRPDRLELPYSLAVKFLHGEKLSFILKGSKNLPLSEGNIVVESLEEDRCAMLLIVTRLEGPQPPLGCDLHPNDSIRVTSRMLGRFRTQDRPPLLVADFSDLELKAEKSTK